MVDKIIECGKTIMEENAIMKEVLSNKNNGTGEIHVHLNIQNVKSITLPKHIVIISLVV